MTNQLPEDSWRDKLHGYSSPVDLEILKKVMDARKSDKGHPFSFWIYLSILFFFLGLTLVLSENKVPLQKSTPEQSVISQHPPLSIDHTKPPRENSGIYSIPNLPSQYIETIADSIQSASAGSISLDSSRDVDKSVNGPTNYSYTRAMEYNVPAIRLSGKKIRPASLSYIWAPPKSYSLPPLFAHGQERFGEPSAKTVAVTGLPDCPNLNYTGRNDWYMEVFGALDMPFKTLKGTTDKSDFIDQKDSSEKFLLSWSAGMRISKNISNSWLIKTGFHYSQINEKFLYQNEKERRITTIVTIRTIVRAPGDTLYVADSSQVEVTGVRMKKTYNRYRNLDIPLLLSYEMRHPGLTIAVQGGTIFNMSSRFTGDMLDTTGLPLSQSGKNPASQFKNSLGFGLYAGASVIKSIGEEVDVFAEPYYRRYLNNHASIAAPFEQYLSAWGVQFGIRYRLNKGGQRY